MSDILRVRDVIWLTPGIRTAPGTCIGMVLYECEVGGFKAYVGIGNWMNEVADAQHIIDWGGRVSDDLAARIWPDVEIWYDTGQRTRETKP